MVDLSVNLGNLTLRNPVMTASGTFGYGEEYEDFIDLSRLGGIIVKGTTVNAREGNPYPRMAETPMGMLNAVGLQNKGVDVFTNEIWPRISNRDTNILVNVSGSTVEEYVETAAKIAELPGVPGIELNISCPNVKEGGMAFGTSCPSAIAVTRAVREVFPRHLMVKLS
ncbi:MAG: dihydroorotate dehydrogenase, partial [Bacteroidales bacterium]|nr:dihydroorotate dehydrogenase [Bacteroidales bacterium]